MCVYTYIHMYSYVHIHVNISKESVNSFFGFLARWRKIWSSKTTLAHVHRGRRRCRHRHRHMHRHKHMHRYTPAPIKDMTRTASTVVSLYRKWCASGCPLNCSGAGQVLRVMEPRKGASYGGERENESKRAKGKELNRCYNDANHANVRM